MLLDSPNFFLASLALFAKIETCDDTPFAKTNGSVVSFGPEYPALPPEQRAFVWLHELLHVALRHGERAAAVQRVEGDRFDPERWNIAGDAIINHALEGLPRIQAVSGCVTFRSLDMYGDQRWSIEELYRHLASTECADKQILSPGGCARAHIGPAGEDCSAEESAWQDRLRCAMGRAPKILQRLGADLPAKPRIDWRHALRSFVLGALGSGSEPTYARPHRRSLALAGSFARPMLAPFVAHTVARTRRIAVVADTSGSIDDNMLAAFKAEMVGLVMRANAHIRIIACDAQAQHIADLAGSQAVGRIRALRLPGGGGTDFRPGIALADEWQPQAIVYLTDMYGTFPARKPRAPVLWVSTSHVQDAPFGRVIQLT